MDSILVIALLGGMIFLLLVLGAPLKPMRMIGQGIIRLIIGALFLFFLNAFGSVFDYQIPLNLATISVSGFLGIPGILALIAINLLIL